MKTTVQKFLLYSAFLWISFSSVILMMMLIVEVASTFGGPAAILIIGATAFSFLYLIHVNQKQKA